MYDKACSHCGQFACAPTCPKQENPCPGCSDNHLAIGTILCHTCFPPSEYDRAQAKTKEKKGVIINKQLAEKLAGREIDWSKTGLGKRIATEANIRPCWDEIWMNMAHEIKRRSIDPRMKVGCVIVTDDNSQVLAVGYNGDQKGGPNRVESVEPGKSGTIHAEVNALVKCDYNVSKRKILYVTLSTCVPCAKLIINAGISEVVYDDLYREEEGIELLKQAGIIVRQYND